MTEHEKVEAFTAELDALCKRYDFALLASEWTYIETTAPGAGHSDLDLTLDDRYKLNAHDVDHCPAKKAAP